VDVAGCDCGAVPAHGTLAASQGVQVCTEKAGPCGPEDKAVDRLERPILSVFYSQSSLHPE